MRSGGSSPYGPTRVHYSEHTRVQLGALAWRMPVARETSARSTLYFSYKFKSLDPQTFTECLIIISDNSELKRRLKAEKKAKEKEAKQAEVRLRGYFGFKRFSHGDTWLHSTHSTFLCFKGA